MLKSLSLIAVALVIALGGGTLSVWLALESFAGVGTVTVGNWTATPLEGTTRADPYTKARFSREGELALGLAEGIRFVAHTDSDSRPLRRDCTYEVRGTAPPTRFWTLFAASSASSVGPVSDRPATVYSRAILHDGDNSFAVAFGPHPVPGNWRSVKGTGPMVFVLTLYDTPVANQASLADIQMPRILRMGCDD